MGLSSSLGREPPMPGSPVKTMSGSTCRSPPPCSPKGCSAVLKVFYIALIQRHFRKEM